MFIFEWDEVKASANFQKHGVTFDLAMDAFSDPYSVEWHDQDLAYGEMRMILLGLAGGTILLVVYTERDERLRLISARRATRHERKIYNEQSGL